MKPSARNRLVVFILLAASLAAGAAEAAAQRVGFSREEFVRRRAALADRLKEGVLVLFGVDSPASGAHTRQDNDFFYFTGVEDLGAILAFDIRTRQARLFLPRQSAREEMVSGANLLKDPEAAKALGLAEILDVSYFDEFIGRRAAAFAAGAWLRLQPGDTIDNDRGEVLLFEGRKSRTHYNAQITRDAYRIALLRERYPQFDFRDATPHIDALRRIKSAEEIEILRRNGRLSAEGVKRAMMSTRPGAFEYEIEAAAMGAVLKGGARGAAYPPIVASGPNNCVWHYDKNERRAEWGDLVLMDFGADLDHLAMDISRTWPVTGAFRREQREAYRVVLEVEKACLAAYKPGATAADVRKEVEAALKAKKIDPRGLTGGFGHFVGMCVHDVGGRIERLEPGMVFAIEPALYYPEKGFGIRIEDTVLITATGCEVLTKDVPKEIEEVEALVASSLERPAGEPERIAVQHILIAFKGSIPEEKVTRSKEEAEKLALELLAEAGRGADFDALVKARTDDEYPGIYAMANLGIAPRAEKKEYARQRMVRAFGDVGFKLKVGEIGLAAFDPKTSPYGWHIIKRVE